MKQRGETRKRKTEAEFTRNFRELDRLWDAKKKK